MQGIQHLNVDCDDFSQGFQACLNGMVDCCNALDIAKAGCESNAPLLHRISKLEENVLRYRYYTWQLQTRVSANFPGAGGLLFFSITFSSCSQYLALGLLG